MHRIPRVRLVLVVAALLALLVVPMAGAWTLSSPSGHSADGSWIGAALRWVEDAVGLRPVHHGHSGTGKPVNTKDDEPAAAHPNSGGCIDPIGRTRPCF